MTIPQWIRVRRITGLAGLLVVAVMAAVMMAGPAVALHRGGHDGGPGGGDEGTNETATFAVVVSGDLAGNVTTTQKNGQVSGIHNIPELGEVLELSMAGFFAKVVGRDGWANCFARGTYSVEGGVIADKNVPGTGKASFHFTALGTDGTTEVKYALAVRFVEIESPSEAVWPDWLPGLNESATVTTVDGASWEMKTTNGPGKKVACTGGGGHGEEDWGHAGLHNRSHPYKLTRVGGPVLSPSKGSPRAGNDSSGSGRLGGGGYREEAVQHVHQGGYVLL